VSQGEVNEVVARLAEGVRIALEFGNSLVSKRILFDTAYCLTLHKDRKITSGRR
jgi:hypothetical protein